MKAFLALLLIGFCCSCRHIKSGSGRIITQERTTDSFVAVHATGGLQVDVIRGATAAVKVEADDNIINEIETKVSGNKLEVRLRDGNWSNITIHVTVTAPVVRELEATGGASLTAKDTISGWDKLLVKADGGGSISAMADAPQVDAVANGGGEVTINGRTKNLNINADGGGSVHAYGLQSESAVVTSGGGGSAEVFASQQLEANASAGGSITYTGGASNVVKNESSGGMVRVK